MSLLFSNFKIAILILTLMFLKRSFVRKPAGVSSCGVMLIKGSVSIAECILGCQKLFLLPLISVPISSPSRERQASLATSGV